MDAYTKSRIKFHGVRLLVCAIVLGIIAGIFPSLKEMVHTIIAILSVLAVTTFLNDINQHKDRVVK